MPVETQSIFYPARRRGLIFNAAAAVFLAGAALGVFLLVYQSGSGSEFVFGILVSLLLAAPLPLLVYRAFALVQGHYILDRDGLRLRWGLRAEDIPLPQIEWVRPAAEMGFRLPLPFLNWPGAIIGTRRVEGLGLVEFLAGERRGLLLVATPAKIYAISPGEPRLFERAFYKIIEFGSLTPIPSYSALPVAFAWRVWNDRLGRGLLLSGFLLGIALFVAAGLTIPGRESVSLGYDALRQPLEPISADRLLLLPVINGVGYAFDLILGLFFYGRPHQRPVAYVLWATSLIMPALLLLATFLIR
jgi:hypothetical protein